MGIGLGDDWNGSFKAVWYRNNNWDDYWVTCQSDNAKNVGGKAALNAHCNS